MDELLPDEIRAIRDSVHRFMETEVNPRRKGDGFIFQVVSDFLAFLAPATQPVCQS